MKLSDALKLFDESETDQSTRKECLITRQEIKNEIILKCNHSFGMMRSKTYDWFAAPF